MRPRRAVLAQFVVASLALWLGVILMSGVTAGVAFPTLKAMDPSLPGYKGANEHWKLAGGAVANRVFRIAGIAEMTLAGVCLGCWTLMLVGETPPIRRGLWAARLIPFAASLGALAYIETTLLPRMGTRFDELLDAARAGDAVRAAAARAAFDADHPVASNALTIQAVLVLLTLSGAVWAHAREHRPAPESPP